FMLLDFQEGVCGQNGVLGSATGLSGTTRERRVLERLEHVLGLVRRTSVEVLHVRLAFDDDFSNRTNMSERFDQFQGNRLMVAVSPETEFCAEARPLPHEPVFTKGGVSPFTAPNLARHLEDRGISSLYLAGVATNFVVESAARHAGDAGFRVTVVEDLCAAHTAEMHEFAIRKTLPTFARICDSETFVGELP
ncbi:MAG TPA: isochorismatase family cysteine hydrolase, partial [Actinopolymorphaceae bacterium]